MCCNPNIYDENNLLLGVILSGGKSSRMGTDKGLIKKDGIQWAGRLAAKVEQLGIASVISINPLQKDEYKNHFLEDYLIEDELSLGIGGPLEGILSVHNRFPNHDLLVIACDLQDISFDTIRFLKESFEERAGEHDIIAYSYEGETEPLVAIYTAEGLNKIFSLLITNQLEKVSMRYILEVSNTYFIEIGFERLPEFKNYNSESDFKI